MYNGRIIRIHGAKRQDARDYLQDSYGVKCAEELIVKLLSVPGEYSGYLDKVMQICKFDYSIGDMVNDAKN